MIRLVKDRLRPLKERLLERSLREALREQGLEALARRLEAEVPDLKRQYSTFDVDSAYLRLKVRGQHAFQIALARSALPGGPAVVVDIGDSAGTHVAYLRALDPDEDRRFMSVNLDPRAVERIRARGLEARLGRAEDLARDGIKADVILAFELLEHLPDPWSFLHALSGSGCRALALSVPYVAASRVGLHHIRAGLAEPVTAETVHLLELCPEDWRLAFAHCGWRVVRDQVYLQYPRRSWLRSTRALWRRLDFEGFYGAVLAPDPAWSSLYADWRRAS